jgi:hypothetical protein
MTPQKLHDVLIRLAGKNKLGHFYILNGRGQQGDQQVQWLEHFIRQYWLQIEKRKHIPQDLRSDADLLWLHPWDEEKEDHRDYQVEDLLPLMKFMGFRGLQSKRRFVVMEDAHRIGNIVANRLLKTLEEPDNEVTFFWTNPQGTKLLPTISSRAQELNLSFAGKEVATALIEEYRQKITNGDYPLALFLEEAKKEAPQLLDELLSFEISHDGPALLKQELLTMTREWKKAQTFNQPSAPRLQWIYTYLNARFRTGR